jgi:hypothetical protein
MVAKQMMGIEKRLELEQAAKEAKETRTKDETGKFVPESTERVGSGKGAHEQAQEIADKADVGKTAVLIIKRMSLHLLPSDIIKMCAGIHPGPARMS